MIKLKFLFRWMDMIPQPLHISRMAKGPYKRRKAPAFRQTGNFVRAWRDFREMTQNELSEATGLSVPQISNIETGGAGYTRSSLEKIAKALDCPPGYLLSHSPQESELAAELSALEPSDRATAIEIIRLMASKRAAEQKAQ